MSHRGIISVTLILLASLAATLHARTWTSREGKTIEADFVDVDEEKVTLRLSTGKESKVKLDLLSDEDQLFLRGILAKRRARGVSTSSDNASSSAPAAKLETNKPKRIGAFGASKDDDGGDADDEASDDSPKRVKIENRTWTDARGNTFTGKFARMQGNMVMIMRGTRQMPSDYFQLSEEDQEYVRDVLESKGQLALVPRVNPNAVAANTAPGGFANPGFGAPMPNPGFSNPMPGNAAFGPGPGIPNPGAGFPGNPGGFGGPGGTPAFPMPNYGDDAARKAAERLADLERKNQEMMDAARAQANAPTPGLSDSLASSAMPSSPNPYGAPSYPGGSGSFPGAPGASNPGFTPPVSHTPSMPDMPSTNFTPPSMPAMEAACSNCNGALPSSITAGDRCPHCKVYLAYDETTGKSAYGGGVSRGAVRGIIFLITIVVMGVIGGITALAKALGGKKPQQSQWG
jgi:hypothetical protein